MQHVSNSKNIDYICQKSSLPCWILSTCGEYEQLQSAQVGPKSSDDFSPQKFDQGNYQRYRVTKPPAPIHTPFFVDPETEK